MTKIYGSFANRALRAAGVTVAALCATNASSSAAQAPPIFVNGAHVAVAAIERDSRVFVPIRGVFERLGAAVVYRGGSMIVVRKQNADIARVMIGRRNAMMLGRATMLAYPPFRSGGHVFVPLRLISESAGASVAYGTAPRTIRITSVRSVRAPASVVEPVPPAPAPAERHDLWWLWLFLGAVLLLLALLFAFLRRRKPEPIILTRSTPRPRDPR